MSTYRLLILVISGLSFSGCGPGIVDGVSRIAGEYYLSDAGDNEQLVMYMPRRGAGSVVIDARVDHYIVEGKKIFLARRPRVLERQQDGTFIARLLPNCEHWEIDLRSNLVTQSAAASRVSCNAG